MAKEKAKKKEKVFIDQDKVMALVEARRPALKTEEKKGFIKVYAAEGRKVYVAKTKTVARIDISGFEMDPSFEGVVRLGGLSFGGVHQQLEFAGRTEEQVLSAFAAVLDHMLTLPAAEKTKRKVGEPKASAPAASAGAASSSKKDRADLIKRVASEKGAKVSPKTESEIAGNGS